MREEFGGFDGFDGSDGFDGLCPGSWKLEILKRTGILCRQLGRQPKLANPVWKGVLVG